MRKGLRKMRKVTFFAAGVLAAVCLTGCGSNAENTTTPGTTVQGSASQEEKTGFLMADYSSYVSLGDYKGISVEAISVSDEEVSSRIHEYFHDIVEEGDTVDIDYVGYLNGEAFDGGTAQGQSLTIGSNQYIDGFESGLIGVKVGETVDLNLTFPENYGAEDLAGKDVVFTVTVNSILSTVAPEFTVENVAANTDYASLEDYQNAIYDQIYSEYNEQRMSDVWNQVLENATISGYPQEEIDAYAAEMADYYNQMAEQYGIDYETFISYYGYTTETMEEACQTYGKNVLNEKMVLYMIAQEEGLDITDDEYRTEMDNLVEMSGMEEEQIVELYGGEDYIRESLLFTKVLDYLSTQVVEG